MNLHKFSIFRQKKDVPLGTSFRLRFIQQLDDFCNLLLALVLISGLKRAAPALFQRNTEKNGGDACCFARKRRKAAYGT